MGWTVSIDLVWPLDSESDDLSLLISTGSSLKCFEENPLRFSGRKIIYCPYFPVQNPKVW